MNWTPPPIPRTSVLFCAACLNNPADKCPACGLTAQQLAPPQALYYADAQPKAIEAYLRGDWANLDYTPATFMGLPPPVGYANWIAYAKAHAPKPSVPMPEPVAPRPTLACPAPQQVAVKRPLPQLPVPKGKINVRAKGQRGEREIVKLVQALVDIATTKHGLEPVFLQRNMLQAHAGGCDLHGLDGFAIEVKFQEIDWNNAWWTQAVRQAQDMSVRGREVVPILFWRKSNVKWMVMTRVWVQTPLERDQIQLDVSMTLENFERWFSAALDEAMEKEAASL